MIDDVLSSTEFGSSVQEGNGLLLLLLLLPPPTSSSWLETFHIEFVHKVTDPSSQASGTSADASISSTSKSPSCSWGCCFRNKACQTMLGKNAMP